ncbi:MAG: hypothetical protein J5602_04070 [Clostridia bacterium]|nr:hypothetical protein [Clostridia bacterium]
MSIKNCSTAIQAVLDDAASRMDNLIVIRVEAGAEPTFLSRRLTLPLSDDLQMAFALGCAQAGMRCVLDLTAVRDAASRLEAVCGALPRAAQAPLVIRARARFCPPVPGVRAIFPSNARECAGAMRYALRSGQTCLIVENPLNAYETCEVPDDPDELFAGAWESAPEAVEAPAQSAPEAGPAEDAAPSAAPEEPAVPEPAGLPDPVAAPTPIGGTAFRSRAYDPAELERTAALLNIARGELAARCCAAAGESAEIILETDSAPGESACIPPEEADACLWVGYDRLTLCWDPRAMSAQTARALIADTAALLELPARLILAEKGKR